MNLIIHFDIINFFITHDHHWVTLKSNLDSTSPIVDDVDLYQRLAEKLFLK